MAIRLKKKVQSQGENVVDLRHSTVTRLNIPPAGIAARGEIAREKKLKYAYNPHLPPALRFDDTGKGDSVFDLLDNADSESCGGAS
jgi:hypothetical protein